MARITRNRQDPALKLETRTTRAGATANTIAEKDAKEKSSKVKTSTKRTLIQDKNTEPPTKGKNNLKTNVKKVLIQDKNTALTTKGKNSNTKSSIRKAATQDENAVPTVNKNKANVKSQSKTSVLSSKLHSTRKNNSLSRRSSILALKSPVLRDRTNMSNEPIRSDTSAKRDVQFIENKKEIKTKVVKKSTKKYNNKNKDKLQIIKYVVKQTIVQNKEIIKENIIENKDTVSNFNKNENKQDKVCSVNSPESNTEKSRKKNNLSMEAVEELLNQEDKVPETENKELDKHKFVEENVPMELDNNDVKGNEKEDKNITKKFFKHKIDTKNIAINLMNRKNPKRLASTRKKVTAAKKVVSNDSTFSPNIKEQRKSTKPEVKKLRTRVVKNYCEVSKVSHNSKSEEKQNKKTSIKENDKKGLPIYKTIELSQENKNKKEVYEFPDDSEENGKKVKKQKRVVKKPTTKRARKAPVLPSNATQEPKKKPLEKVTNKVQFKEQPTIKEPIMQPKQDNKSSGYTNIEIPEDLQNAGDSTIAEAPTIKITSDKLLEGSERINLMLTPSAPKTINSELKLFGPTNAITSQPKIQYSNMVNHSLIRQSMSPITKEVDDFDIGSPWRPIDAFSRVQKVVQSTPQINRVLAGREKKPLIQMNLNKKSIGSENTIHLSSITNEKLTKQTSTNDVTQTQKENVSPRKFGTVISNLNSMETMTNSGIKQASLQSKLQSPAKTALTSTSFENDVEMQDHIPPISSPLNKENNDILSPKKSPVKKIQTPSPFRFDRLRSSKRIAATEFKSNTENSISQKENKDPNAIAGPLDSEKSTALNTVAGPSDSENSKAVILRQSNLNNFLNLDEMPESSRISTPHGIFDDIHSTPINGKKPQKILKEPNIENAFGFDDCDFSEEISDIGQTSGPMIATEKDVANSVKGKLFPNARVKSKWISKNEAKETLLKNVLTKNLPELITPENNEKPEKSDKDKENSNTNNNNEKSEKNEDKEDNNKNEKPEKNDEVKENNNNNNNEKPEENVEDEEFYDEDEDYKSFTDLKNNNQPTDPKKALVEAVSFSDTFDVLSENGEDLSTKIPDEVPLFVDLEPLHFTEPPRRSYSKRKLDCSDHENKRKRRKKESRLSKEDRKRLKEWIKSTNESFKEIDHFDLVVE